MFPVKEFRVNRARLCDYLPWAMLVGKGIVLNKDGSLQKTYRYRGRDIDSIAIEDVVSIAWQVNNALKRLDSGWSVWAECRRSPSRYYPKMDTSGKPWVVAHNENERYRRFSSGMYYSNEYYLTLSYMPPQDVVGKFFNLFVQKGDTHADEKTSPMEEVVSGFVVNANRWVNIFRSTVVYATELDDSETLTYLHGIISPKNEQTVEAPMIPVSNNGSGITMCRAPVFLDAILSDTDFVGGIEPSFRDGKEDFHLRVVTLNGYPTATVPAVFHSMNALGIDFRFVMRYIALDKIQAIKEAESYAKKWFSQRKSMFGQLKETFFHGQQEDESKSDPEAVGKAAEAKQAQSDIANNYVSYGYCTLNFVLMDKDAGVLKNKVETVEKLLNNLGFVAYTEAVNAVSAWFSTHPGNIYANVRRPLISSANVAHLMPISDLWSGDAINKHFDQPCLFTGVTRTTTPFYVNLHVGDVGHTFIIGPTGSGKSVLLNFLILNFLKYPNAKVFSFDKGKSSYVTAHAVGGAYYDLGTEDGVIHFQPFANIENDFERMWAQDWIIDLLTAEGVDVTPQMKHELWATLTNMAESDKSYRNFSSFVALVQDINIRHALSQYASGGPYGTFFDATEDLVISSSVQFFEMEQLMYGAKQLVVATLFYLFHRLEQQFDGSPALLVLDEAWSMLDHPQFALKIREWLKVLRKKNVSVVFATQSLSDVIESKIASAILDSVSTRIFLPNPKALDPNVKAIYAQFGLNRKEIENLSVAQQKRFYYLTNVMGNRMFELGLNKDILAIVGGAGPETFTLVDSIKRYTKNCDEFTREFLKARNSGI